MGIFEIAVGTLGFCDWCLKKILNQNGIKGTQTEYEKCLNTMFKTYNRTNNTDEAVIFAVRDVFNISLTDDQLMQTVY